MKKAIKYLDKLAAEHAEKGKFLYETNPLESLDNYVIESQLRFASTKLSEAEQANEKSVLPLDDVRIKVCENCGKKLKETEIGICDFCLTGH